jgi:uncharacterized protein (TIGR02145 family)
MIRFTVFFLLLTFPFTQIIGQTIYAGTDTTICLGGTATLNAVVTGGGYGTDSYTFETYAFSPEAYSGGTQVNFAGNQDDQIAGPFSIGFSFCFFNQTYTQFYIGSNGWVGFTFNNSWVTFTSAPIPSTDPAVPKNCIMAPWEDWYPNYYPTEKNVYFYTTGTAPNRKLVVYWNHCPMYGCYTTYGTFQIVLNEQTSIIENHITDKPYCSSSGGTATQGVHRLDGLVAFTATGRNSTVWTTTNESTRFVPSGIKWYTGGYPGGTIVGYGATLIQSPATTTVYTAVVETCGSGTATDDVTVFVLDPTFSYSNPTFCSNDPDPVANVLQSGGTFSVTPAGLVFLNTTTGEIDLSASIPGPYTITYTISTPCTISQSHPLTIVAPPAPPVASPDTVRRCGPGDVSLNVVQAPGTKTYWWDSPTGGFKYPFSGTPFVVNISASAVFYADAVTDVTNCTSLSRTPVVAIVKPVPVVSNTTLNFQLCSGTTTNIVLQSSIPNSTFTWTAVSAAPGITGYSDGSGDVIQHTLSNTGNTAGIVKYSVIPHFGGCDGIPVEFNVTVFPFVDVLFNPTSPSICSGQKTNIGLVSNVTGPSFTWTATASSPSVTGYSDGNGDLIEQTLVTPGVQVESVTYHITPSANGCNGPVVDYSVIINPKPHLTNQPMAESICSENSTNINLTASCLNTTFTWTATLLSGNVTGFSNGSGPVISQVLTNLLTTTGQVQYTINPQAGPCAGNDTNYIVDVKPMPHLTNNPPAKSICNNANTGINLSSDVTGSLFTWTATGSSLFVTGYSDNSTPTVTLNQTLINSGYNVETVTYHLIPHANGCDGPVTNYVVTVYPVPDLSNIDRTDSICDSAITSINLGSHVSGTLFTWRAFGSSPLVTGYSSSTVPGTVINQRLENNGFVPQTVTYRLLPAANGCAGDSTDFTVTLFPTPNLNNNPLVKEICNNNNTNIVLTSNVTGTMFTWTCTPSSGNISGYSNSIVPLTIISQNLVNSGNTTETVTYHITPHANGCNGWTYHFVVTVVPSPYLTNNPLRKTQCNNQNTNLTLTSNVLGTLFNWTATASSPALTGYSNSTGPGTLIAQTLGNTGFNIDSVTYHITPETSGCPGSVTDFHVVVFPTPDLSNPVHTASICDSTVVNIPLLSNVSNTTFTWRAFASSPNLTGFANQATGTTLLSQRIDNSGFTIETVTYRILPRANNCTGDSTDIVVTVFPSPNLSNLVHTGSICDSTFATMFLTSTVAGTNFTWRAFASSPALTGFANQLTGTTVINQLIDNTGFTTETVTYRVLPFANGCPGDSVDIIFTVFPTPDLANVDRTDSICDSAFTSIILASHVTGTQFTWRAFGSSPLVMGYSGSSIPGLIISQRLQNNGFVPQTVTYRLLPAANGCLGDSIDYVVTVFPTPDLNISPLSKEICNNNNTNISLTSNVAGTLFTWTCTPSSGNITGYSNSIAPLTLISQNLINTGNTPETVTYNITPHANGCNGWVYHYVVTVVPSPYLTNSPLRKTQCNNQNTNLTLTSNVVGTQFNWTATASSPALTGYSNSVAPGVLISQTLGNTGFNVDSVTYHITPVTSGCPGSVTDYNVVVFPTPDIYFIPNGESVCEGQASGLTLHSNVSGTTYSWTATASSPNLSGYYNSSGNAIVQTISNSGTTTETVTYHVTPAANGCPPGTTMDVVLAVKPRPSISNTITTFQICSNTTYNILLTADVPSSTFAWRAFASSPSLGGYFSGSGPIINQTLTNSGFTNGTVTFRVSAAASGCAGDSTDFIVTVFPVPDVYFIPASQTICPLQISNISINSHVAGSSFSWTASGSSLNVSGYSPGAGSSIQQILDNTGPDIESVTYLVAPTANGCPGISNNVVVTVNPAPQVSLTLCIDPVISTDAQPVKLKGGLPVNGAYSGPGVTGTTLFPAVAGPGMDTIRYSYTNTFGCSHSNYIIISIISPLPFTCGNIMTDPRDGKQYSTVQIGTQCWMAADLNYGQQLAASGYQRDNCVVEKYCYSDNPGACAVSGGLYQWDELMKYDNVPAGQGLCPPGWHVPTEADWSTLFSFYISNSFAGSPLKYTGYSGFNALLDGVRFKNASWNFSNFATLFWSSTSHGPYKAWAHGMNQNNPSVSNYPSARNNAFPVRCIKD